MMMMSSNGGTRVGDARGRTKEEEGRTALEREEGGTGTRLYGWLAAVAGLCLPACRLPACPSNQANERAASNPNQIIYPSSRFPPSSSPHLLSRSCVSLPPCVSLSLSPRYHSCSGKPGVAPCRSLERHLASAVPPGYGDRKRGKASQRRKQLDGHQSSPRNMCYCSRPVRRLRATRLPAGNPSLALSRTGKLGRA